MKKRKFLAVLCTAIMLCGTISAYANPEQNNIETKTETPKATITIKPSQNGGTNYTVYKLFDAVTDAEGEVSEDDHISYTVNPTYKDELQSIINAFNGTGHENDVLTSNDIVNYVSKLNQSSNPTIDAFSQAVYKVISETPGNENADYFTVSRDSSTEDAVITVPYGYYLIKDETVETDMLSSNMITVNVGSQGVTVTVKEDTVPTFEKKIVVTNDGAESLEDYLFVSPGETVTFQLKAEVPSILAGLGITDSMETTIGEYADITNVNVKLGTDYENAIDLVKTDDYTISDVEDEEAENVDGNKVIDLFDIDFISSSENLIDASNEENTQYIFVRYDVVLDGNGTLKLGGSGNLNEAFLEYCSDPYVDESEGIISTQITVPDTVALYSLDLNITKVDNGTNPLQGAEFLLYSQLDEKGVPTGDSVKLTAGENGLHALKGIKPGTYYLVESVSPTGYNLLDGYVKIIIDPTVEESENIFDITNMNLTVNTSIESLSSSVDNISSDSADTGIISMNIHNSTGPELPTTGGMGTYIIYGTGLAIMAIAVVMILKKKKK